MFLFPAVTAFAQLASNTACMEPKQKSFLGWLTTIALSAALWALLAGSLSWHEVAVGLFAVVLAIIFIAVVYSHEQRRLQFRLADLVQLWRVPGEVLHGICVMVGVLAADLAGRRAGDYFRFSGVQTGKDDPVLAGRRALITLYGSVSPDTLVLGVDYAQNRVLLHQLNRAPLSQTLRRLGVKP